jgi:hypothetical protein
MASRSAPPNGGPQGPNSAPDSDHSQRLFDVAVYAMDALSPQERQAVEEHILDCGTCQQELAQLREVAQALGEVPPEAFLDGAPEDADLLVRRTLRQIRAADGQPATSPAPAPARPLPSNGHVPALDERRSAGVGRRPFLLGAAAAAVVAAVVVGGAVGRSTAPTKEVTIASPAPNVTAVPGTRAATSTDSSTGATLTAEVIPARGWVRVNAGTSGIKSGQRCTLLVVSRTGEKVEAGSWLVSEANAAKGTKLAGSALVAPADVVALEVRNSTGQVLVRTEV